MIRVNYWRVVLGALAFVLLLNPVSAMSAENLKKVIIAIPSITINMTPLWIAQEKGFFKEEGLDVEVTYIRGNTVEVQAILSGQVHAAWGGAAAPLSAIAAGGDVVIVASVEGKMGFVLASAKQLKIPSELNGKKYAVSAPGGSSEVATRYALAVLGADPKSAIMMNIGGSQKILAALKSGSCDVGMISGPTFAGSGMGLNLIVDLSETENEFPHSTIFVSKKWASDNRDAVLGLIRGYVRGFRFFESKKEESIKIASPHLKNPERSVLENQWQYCATHTYDPVPYMTRKGFNFIVGEMAKVNPKMASLKFEDAFDASYVNELLETGLFTRRAMKGRH